MKKNRAILKCSVVVSTVAYSCIATAQWNPQPGWKDSYAVDGRCYCDSSNFDHNLSSKSADTPLGKKNVVEICNDIRDKLGTGSKQGRIPFNDIQCGHGPANDAADEAACPGRVDIGPAGCDVKGPRWDLQAVYGDNAPPTPAPEPVPNEPTIPDPPTEPILLTVPEDEPPTADACNIITVTGASLDEAKQQFSESCAGLKREDCDPVSADHWMCSTATIDSSTVVPPVSPPPATDPDPTPDPEPAPDPVPPSADSCEAQGPNLIAAISAYASNCPNIPRRDCDPTGNNQWTCSSDVIGEFAPRGVAGGGNTPPVEPTPTEPDPVDPAPVEPDPVDPAPVEPDPDEPEPIEPAPDPEPGNSIGKVGANDLVALHYDNCPDRDDGHAMAAGKAVVVRLGLPNVLVVNGTCADNIRNSYQESSEAVARAVWVNQWLNSDKNGDASEQTSAERWAAVLANSGEVWVAEGGPSDFTARVLRRIQNQFPSVDLKNVHVVQHSTGNSFNEARTARDNIALVKRVADYVAIPNGNGGGNGSAGLRNNSSFFVETARRSEFSGEWDAAFNYLDPNERLDFSDTVELLYMVEDTDTQTVDDFARRYLQ